KGVHDKVVTVLRTLGSSRADGALPLKICVTSGVDEGREVPLGSLVEIGSDASCGLVLTDPAVSRQHVPVTGSEGRILVKDLNSRNGTLFGGARVREIEVPVGAVLQIGHSELAIQARWYVREVAPSNARSFGELSGESVSMREVFAVLERAGLSEVTVL